MKAFLLALLLAPLFAHAGERPYVTKWRAAFDHALLEQKEDPKQWVSIDTGESIDLGLGEAPVVEVYRKDLPHTCFVALHPTNVSQMAVIECFPRVPEKPL